MCSFSLPLPSSSSFFSSSSSFFFFFFFLLLLFLLLLCCCYRCCWYVHTLTACSKGIRYLGLQRQTILDPDPQLPIPRPGMRTLILLLMADLQNYQVCINLTPRKAPLGGWNLKGIISSTWFGYERTHAHSFDIADSWIERTSIKGLL